MNRTFGTWMAGLLLGAGAIATLPAWPAAGQQVSEERTFAIPAQPLNAALLAFAGQAGLEILVDSRLAQGAVSPGVQGRLTTEEALRRLLTGTGVTHRFTSANTITLERLPEPADGTLILAPITVAGERQTRSLAATTTSTAVLPEPELKRADSTRVYDAIRNVPNVTPSPPDFLPPIRGVDSNGPAGLGGSILMGTSPRSKLIVDDVSRPIAYTNNAFQSLFDVEQVEVLRGPQTTLRGSNAIAGAYVVKTKDPVFAVEGETMAGIDWNEISKHGYRGAFMVNTPVVADQLAVRIVAEYENGRVPVRVYDDGTAPDGTDFRKRSDFDTLSLRGKALLAPVALPDLTALLTVEYQSGRDIGFDSWIWGTDDGCCAARERRYGYSGQQRILDTRDKGVTLNAAYALGDGSEIRSISSYQLNGFKESGLSNSFVEFTSLEKDVVSQDILYSFGGAGAGLEGVLGATYSRETDSTDLSGFDFSTEGERNTVAAFADLTVHLRDDLRLLAGGRLQRSRSQFRGDAFGGIAAINVDQTDTVLLPKLGLAVDVAPGQTLFATVRRGYNIGGGGIDFLSMQSYEFKPEYVWTYELGYRGGFLDGRLDLNATAFYNTYKDYQFFYSPNPWTNRILNYDGVTYGAELEVRGKLSTDVVASFGTGLLRTEIDAPGQTIDGNRFGRDPELTLTGGVVWNVTPAFSVDARATYVSRYFAEFLEAQGTGSGDYVNVDLGATYRFDTLTLRGFVRNLTDELQYFSRSTAGGSGYVLPPRTFGATVNMTF